MCIVIRSDLVCVRLVVKKFGDYHTEKTVDLDTKCTCYIV